MRYDAIVIGAGHNGLVCACYLARSGLKPLVLERSEIVGGACVTEEVWPGYRVSVGAYLCSLLQPEIVRDLNLQNYGFEVYARETAGFAPFPDGSSLFLYADETKTREALSSFCSARDVGAYFRFEKDVERAARVLDPWFGADPPTGSQLQEAFNSAGCSELYGELITGSVRDLLDGRFEDDRLKTVLVTDGLIGTYGGPSTPGTAYVLLHHYMGRVLGSRGAWGYVRGGMGTITQGLAACLLELGGEIRTGVEAEQIVLGTHPQPPARRGRGEVTGVRLTSGEVVGADVVLSNADPYRTFAQMLPPDAVPNNPTWNRLKACGGASAKINLAVSELPRFSCLPGVSQSTEEVSQRPELLGTVHLCSGLDALERAWDEASRGYPSTEPMIEMYLQTATDTSLTPPGRHILSLFVQYFPYNLAAGLELNEERDRFADRVIEICGRYAPNVPGSVLHRQVLTPRDIEERFGLTGGHIFHGDLLPPTLFADRNPAKLPGGRTAIRGLYLCGSGTHPGGCVMGAPGRIAAEAVLADIDVLSAGRA